jgi:hypothetical protein
VNPLPATRKPFFGNTAAMLLKKSDALSRRYSRYSADDTGRCRTADDSRCFRDGTRGSGSATHLVVVRVPYFTSG